MRSRRRRTLAGFVTAGLARGQQAAGLGKIYGFGLLLLLLVVFMLLFRGRAPRPVEKVFAPARSEDPTQAGARRRELEALLGGAWLDPEDGAGFAETPGYARLLLMLNDHARPGEVVENPPPFDRELALRAPDLQRGRLVRVRGIAGGLWAEKLDNPVFRQGDVWRTVLTDNDGEAGVVVDVMNQPPALELRRDTVATDAWFYRLVRYENKRGNQLLVPYLLARSLTVDSGDAEPAIGLSHPAAQIVGIAILCVLGWGVARFVLARRRPPIRWRAPRLENPRANP
jgi:hypothetical protein